MTDVASPSVHCRASLLHARTDASSWSAVTIEKTSTSDCRDRTGDASCTDSWNPSVARGDTELPVWGPVRVPPH